MCQNTSSTQDYSLLTANTGVAKLQAANPNLDGTGNLETLITAGANGTIVKSISIKALTPNVTGNVRLFIKKTDTVLYKEIPITITPTLSATPTPTPLMAMYETKLVGDLKLEAGTSLVASTQVRQQFTIVTEGLDWDYPNPLPTDCCNFKQTEAITGASIIKTANANLDGTGTIVSVLTAPSSATSNGTFVKNITIKALQSTSINGAVRVFLSTDGGNTFYLMREILVPQTEQSAYVPSYKQIVALDMNIQPDAVIGVSTQLDEAFGIVIEGESWSYPI